MDLFVDQMRQHRAAAVAERERLDARIKALDVLIEQETAAESPTTMTSTRSSARTDDSRPLPALITEVLTHAKRSMDFAELYGAVRDVAGEVNEKSLRGTLPRMEREGKIVKPRRGVYALPQNADSSTVATVELSDLSDQMPAGGECTDGQGSHHDRSVDFEGRDSDRDHFGTSMRH